MVDWTAGDHVTEDEAKLYLGTWAMMKAPFILSVDFARNSKKPDSESNWPQWILPLISNPHLIALSQDALSVQVRIMNSQAVQPVSLSLALFLSCRQQSRAPTGCCDRPLRAVDRRMVRLLLLHPPCAPPFPPSLCLSLSLCVSLFVLPLVSRSLPLPLSLSRARALLVVQAHRLWSSGGKSAHHQRVYMVFCLRNLTM